MMARRKWAVVCAVFCLAGIGTEAVAQSNAVIRDPANRADVQCMAIAAFAGGSVETGSVEQLGLMAAMTYFLGRLEGRAPGVDWLDQMGAYLVSADETEIKTQADRCGGEMVSFGGRMTAWSEGFKAIAAKKNASSKEARSGQGSVDKP